MGLRINTNIASQNAARQTRNTTLGLNRALERLASGLRINRAADDAAGLAIAERFQTRVRQLTAENTALQSGINAAQTAEGGLQVQQDAVARIRELAVQASNGTLNDENRQALNLEAQQLLEQIGDVGEDTQFNGLQLLNGDAADVDLGTEGTQRLNINESSLDTLGLQGLDISTVAGATDAINRLDTAASRIGSARANIGAQENRFQSAIQQREIETENSAASESFIRDADYARVVQDQIRSQLLLQGGTGALAQSNILPQTALQLLGG